MNQAKRDDLYRMALEHQVVDAARDLLGGRICVTEAARQITGPAHELGSALDEPFATFLGIDSETDAFPLGAVREHWSPTALQRQDAERARYEAAMRNCALEGCREILRRFDAAA